MKRLLTLLLGLMLVLPGALAEAPAISGLSQDELFAVWRDAAKQLRAIGAYPFSALKAGASGEDVAALQTRLSGLNYYVPVTSSYDKATTAAVKAFQKAAGLKATGNASVEDQITLFSSTATPQPDVEYVDIKTRKFAMQGVDGKVYITSITLKIKNNTADTILRVIPGIKAYGADGAVVEQSPTYFPAIAEAYAKNPDVGKYKTMAELYATQEYDIGPGQTLAKDEAGSPIALGAVDDIKQLEIAILGYEASDAGIVMFADDDIIWIPLTVK